MPVKKGKLKPNDYQKIQQNFTYLCDEVDARDLTDELFQENVLTQDDIEEIEAIPAQGKRTKAFLGMVLNAGPGDAYTKFLAALKQQYEHVAQKLEETISSASDVEEPWTWFDDIPPAVKSATISDGDTSRISSTIGDGWEAVILRLGMTSIDISRAQSKHPRSPILVITSLLISWRQKKGRSATLQCLVDVLREFGTNLEIDTESLKQIILKMSSAETAPLVTSV